jgi:hypothetical protein
LSGSRRLSGRRRWWVRESPEKSPFESGVSRLTETRTATNDGGWVSVNAARLACPERQRRFACQRANRGHDFIVLAALTRPSLAPTPRFACRKPSLARSSTAHEAVDRPDRIVRLDIILDPGRKQAALLAALAALERAIRHKPNRTPSNPKCPLFSPSLVGSNGIVCAAHRTI